MIISNTTPLINFAVIGRLDLLFEMFGSIAIPLAGMGWFSSPFEAAMLLGTISSFVFVFFSIFRRRTSQITFFSGIFVLALRPFIFTSLLAVYEVNRFIDKGIYDAYYAEGRLQGPVNTAVLGACSSLVAIIAHTVAYLRKGSGPKA